MAQKTAACTRATTHAIPATGQTKDGGGDKHLLIGVYKGYTYKAYADFQDLVSVIWSNVKQVQSAYLVLTTKTGAHEGFPKSGGGSGIWVKRMLSDFSDPNDDQDEGEFIAGSFAAEKNSDTHATAGWVSQTNDAVTRINITDLIEDIAPSTVLRRDGGKGRHNTFYGFALVKRSTSTNSSPRVCVTSEKYEDEPARPYIELNYVPMAAANTVALTAPAGAITQIDGNNFEGTFTPGETGRTLAGYDIELYLNGGTDPVWKTTRTASPNEVETGIFTVPLEQVGTTGSRYTLKSATTYQWRARAKDNKGSYSAWTSKTSWSISTSQPVLSALTPSNGASFRTLNNITLGATYSDPEANPLRAYHIQFRSQTAPSDPDWDSDLLWDSDLVAPSTKEKTTNVIRRLYGGPSLDPGTYSWRIQATDHLGAESDWYYADITLTVGYEQDPGDVQLLTGYGKVRTKARILIKGMRNKVQYLWLAGSPDGTSDGTPAPTGGTFKLEFDGQETAALAYDISESALQTALLNLSNIGTGEVTVSKSGNIYTITFFGALGATNVPRIRVSDNSFTNKSSGAFPSLFTDRAPGYPVAIIEDAGNIGASEMYNSGGEMYFTLPATHPQVAVIEPYQVHYSVEQYRGESWRPIAEGLITDFDADDNSVIFYGQDYYAILARLVDERFNGPTSPDAAAVLYPATGGGAKYVNKTITEVVTDQIDRAINDPGSPLKFMTRGTIAAMDERITIFTTFKERLPFIAGLLESHRAGTGKRTRLTIRKSASGAYTINVIDQPGVDRDNIRFEYGGLVNGFRVIPFGDYATRVTGIGRAINSAKVEHVVVPHPVPTGEVPSYFDSRYGAFPRPNLWQDVADLNDLKRRAKQYARGLGKLGKHLALGIRVGGIKVKDGWDITDSILVAIDRGVVDTSRMGSGYWTVWGWQWTLRQDGYENITLSIMPKEDDVAADEDLIASDPILSTLIDWQIIDRDPDPVLDGGEIHTSVNSITGEIWQRDTTTGEWFSRTADLTGTPAILSDASLNIERYTADVRPVRPVGTLPITPDPNYVEGDVITLTSADGKVYRLLADGTWTAALDGGDISSGTLPPSALDTLAPKAPTGLTLTTTFTTGPGGDPEMGLSVALTQPTENTDDSPLTDLYATYVEVTDDPEDPAAPDPEQVPSWTRPLVGLIGANHTSVMFMGIRGVTRYWVRARSVDTFGNFSAYSDVADYTTEADNVAPGVPQAVVLTGGYRGVGVKWEGSDARDLMFYEVRYTPDDGLGAPDTALWKTIRTRANALFISGLDLDFDITTGGPKATPYWVQVRAIDFSGNVATSNTDPTPLAFNVEPEAGWSDVLSDDALPVGVTDIAANSITTNLISTDGLDASVVRAGYLRVGTTDNFADGIEVWNSGVRAVKVDENGIYIGDTTVGLPFHFDEVTNEQVDDFDSIDYIFLSEAGLTVYKAGVAQTAITPDGIDATAINFGNLPGGHNIVANSSFELADFVGVPTANTWTVQADWTGSRAGTNANTTEGTNSLTIADTAY